MGSSITPNLNNIILYLKTQTKDEEYNIDIFGNDQIGYTVQCMYGKRGSIDLQTVQKNNLPVDYKTARQIFDKEVSKRQSKGYITTERGSK